MRRKKQRPGDEKLVRDESADPVERASALMRLAVDGRFDLRDVAVAWLSHPEGMLRSEAITLLLGGWWQESILPAILDLLHHDPEPEVRSAAAHALSTLIEDAPSHRDRIMYALMHQLEHDDDPITQSTCYEELLRHILPHEARPDIPHLFDRERDVDWELLRPWRNTIH